MVVSVYTINISDDNCNFKGQIGALAAFMQTQPPRVPRKPGTRTNRTMTQACAKNT